MTGRLIETLRALDPGGVKFVRGLHMLAAGLATAAACHGLAAIVAVPDPSPFAAQGAVVAIFAFFLSPQGSRRSETIAFLSNIAIAFAVFAAGVLIGWGDLGYGSLPIEIAWVVVIAATLYCRRYGPAFRLYGLMAAFTFMFVTLLNPTRDEALWLMLAAVVAAAVTMVVHNVLWRPSPTAVYKRQTERFLAIAANELGNGHAGPAAIMSREARQHWQLMVMVARQASAERPPCRRRFQQADAAGLRILMALQVMKDAVARSDDSALDDGQPRNMDRLYGTAREILEAVAGGRMAPSDAFEADLHAAGQALIADRTLKPDAKYDLVRQLMSLRRIVDAAGDIEGELRAIATPAAAGETASPTQAPKGDPEGVGWRLALQGLVAASIAAAIGYGFDLSHAYWATMTVFIVLCASLGATIKRTLARIVGTAAGVFVAVAIQPMIADSLILQVALACLAGIPFFVLLDRHYMLVSGLVGFLVVIALHVLQGIGVDAMLSRTYQTALGAGLAMLAAWLVFPIRARDHVRPLVDKLLGHCRAAIEAVEAGDAAAQRSQSRLNDDSKAIADELDDANQERFILRHHGPDSSRLVVHIDAIVGFLVLYIGTIHSLRDAAVPDTMRGLEDELAARVCADLSIDIDDRHDLDDLVAAWQAAAPLDGSVPAHEAMLVVEELYYARRLVDTAAGLRSSLAELHV